MLRGSLCMDCKHGLTAAVVPYRGWCFVKGSTNTVQPPKCCGSPMKQKRSFKNTPPKQPPFLLLLWNCFLSYLQANAPLTKNNRSLLTPLLLVLPILKRGRGVLLYALEKENTSHRLVESFGLHAETFRLLHQIIQLLPSLQHCFYRVVLQSYNL